LTHFLLSYGALIKQHNRWQLLSLFGLMLLASLTEGVGILLLVPLLDLLSGHSAQGIGQILWKVFETLGIPQTIGGVLATFVVLVALRSAIQYGRDQLSVMVQHTIVDRLRLECFAALMRVEWRWLINSRKSDQASLLLTDVSRVGNGLNFGLALLVTFFTFVAYLTAAVALSWQMTLFALVSGLLVLGLLSGQRRAALHLGQSMGQANRALQGYVQEALSGIKLSKILGNERTHLRYFASTVSEVRNQHVRFASSTSASRALFQLGGAILLVAYLYIGLNFSQAPIPELLTLVLIFSRIIPLFTAGQQQFHHCLHALPALKETQTLLQDCRLAAEPEIGSTSLWPVQQGITLERVTIAYESRDTPALNQVSVTFPAKTTTAIMGASGAGKSTLADVVMGLLAPDQGEVRVDGIRLSDAERMRWRHSVAYVPQEVFLFHESIRNNLLWGNANATQNDMQRVLQMAAAEFVFNLPQGLDTVVGDGGVRLSGGERQRIALARALLKHPSLLILDEATSALDVDNEARVRDAIEKLHGDLTMIIIGHRLPTLEHADQVIVLEVGRIVQQGSWQDIQNIVDHTK
jgi:ATP-binding cassette subfamily C protein